MKERKQFDILCIGDIVTDIFIKLLDDEAHTYKNEQGEWLAIPFGTKLPFHHSETLIAVGNAANAAVSCARLGLNVAFDTNVGGDQAGRDMIAQLEKEGIDHSFVHVNPKEVSNLHFVLWYKEERTILINHQKFAYRWPHIRNYEIPRWVYFSSVSEDALDYHDEVSDWLDRHPDIKLAFQPGTFQMKAGVKRMQRLYARSEVMILNREEAVLVTGGDYNNIHDLMDKFHAYGCKIVVITDGPAGAYASDGQNRYKMPLYPDPAPPYERTGAGDAYSSTLVAALAKGYDLEGALQWAPINSMSVVQKAGAQAGLLTERELEAWLRKAPDWYHPSPF